MIDPAKQIEYIARVQQEMSRDCSMREHVRAIVDLGMEIREPDLWFGVIVGDDDASYHVLGTGPLDPDLITEHALLALIDGPGELPRLTGGVIADLMAAGTPTVVHDLTVSPDDPVVGEFADRITCAMAVPLYWGGRIIAWSVSFSEDPSGYDDSMLAMALNNANLVLHSVARDELFQRVETLHERVSKQVQAVAKAQQALLPQKLPRIDGYEIAVSYRPCEAAGGDYYDFMLFPDERLGIAIADASGHGTSAAVTMAIMRATMSAYRVSGREPEFVVHDVNRALSDAIPEDVFVTAVFALLDPGTGEVVHVTCGHPRGIIRRTDGSLVQMDDGGGPPLGIVEDLTVEPGGPFLLEPGDTLLFYTDGITETFDADHTLYGIDRLESVFAQHDGDATSLIAAIEANVREFAGRDQLDDDQTIIVIRRCEAS